jgi:hypothetical protein
MVPWADYSADQVEDIVAGWLVRMFEGAQRIDGSGGDDGCDVRVPEQGGYRVFEIKSFHRLLTAGQKRQIRESLVTATERQSQMLRWTLVMPKDPTPAEIRWFETVLAPLAQVPIDWIGRTPLEAGLSEHRDLLRAFAPGSTERRAMDLLGEYNAEQAAMTRGMLDGVERLKRLHDQFGLVDPDWNFDVSAAGENITVNLRPKTSGSVERRPIKFGLSIDPNADPATHETFEQFIKYGRPGDIPGGSISDLRIDLPGNLNDLISQGSTPSISIRKTPEEMSWRLNQRIEAVKDERVIGTLPVEWTDRSLGPLGGTWLSGRDRSGYLELAIRSEPNSTGGLSLRAGASMDVLPGEALSALRFLAKLGTADRLRLRSPEHPVTELKVTGDLVGPPGAVEKCILVAAALARIQEAIETFFPLPAGWSAKDDEMLYFYDQILLYGEVKWYWPECSIRMPAETVAKLLVQGTLPRVSMAADSGGAPTSMELMGHQIILPGKVRCVVENIIIMNPRLLAKQIADLAPGAPVVVDLGCDDRTATTFFLDRTPESQGADSGAKSNAVAE